MCFVLYLKNKRCVQEKFVIYILGFLVTSTFFTSNEKVNQSINQPPIILQCFNTTTLKTE